MRPLEAIVFQHAPHEGIGRLGPALEKAGFTLVTRNRALQPSDAEAPLVVVLGGPMGAYETGAYPFLLDELRMLRHRVTRPLPVLGVCLGAQLLAAAAGARVFPGGSGFELGAFDVTFTPDGCSDAVFGPAGASLCVAHWHGDTHTPVPGGVRLAGTPRYPEQAFRLGESYGLQFHVELDGATFRRWAAVSPVDLARAERTLERIEEEAARLEDSGPALDELCARLAAHFARAANAFCE